MRRMVIAVGALMLSSGATAMPVSTFLAKADALKAKGALAMFSGDLKLLMNQVKADAASIRQERLAAKVAGKPTAFCPPEQGSKMSDKDVLAAMQAVPAAERARTDSRTALKAFLVRRYPCRG